MELLPPSAATSSASPDRPSLFELLAQDQLRDLLQPAVRYVLAVLAQSYPRYLIPVVNRHEEYYAALMLLVERHNLLKNNASYSEHFYGLKRRRAGVLSASRMASFDGDMGGPERLARTKLRRKHFWLSMAQLVLLPYFRMKLHELFLSLGGGIDASILPPELPPTDASPTSPRLPLSERAQAQARRIFLATYPWISTGWQVGSLAWHIAYLFEKTSFWSIETWALGLEVGRMNQDDLPPPALPSTTPKPLLSRLYSSTPSILPTLLLLLKFLEFYHSPTSPFQLLSTSSASSLTSSSRAKHPPLPPPPRLLPTAAGAALLAKHGARGQCPVCGLAWRGATVGGSGGWIYCWTCIWEAVGDDEDEKEQVKEDQRDEKEEKEDGEREPVKAAKGRCPVSGLRLRRDELRRVLV